MTTADEIKRQRDECLLSLAGGVPLARHLGIVFDRRGDEITATLPFTEQLVGNPFIPAIHGGATAAFLEVTAIVELTWKAVAHDNEAIRRLMDPASRPRLPKTISFSIDYLRPGLARDSYARATVNRSGRRYASVHVEGWQDKRSRLFAEANGQFLMPSANE